MLRPAGPDFLAVDDVLVALTPRRGAERGGVGARGRLGHAEGLQPQLSRRDLRQICRLLRFRAMAQHCAHRVHLGMAGGGVAACPMHFLQYRRAGGQGQTEAAEFFGDQGGKISVFCQRLHELGRVSLLAILLAPVFAGKPLAQFGDSVADFGVVKFVGHGVRPCCLPFRPSRAPRSGKALREVKA